MREGLRLRPYQAEALRIMLHRQAFALWLKPGLGKTVVTLDAIHELRRSGVRGHVLITAPLNVVRSTWDEEIRKWGFDDLPQRYLSVRIESGATRTRKAREKQYMQLRDAPDSLLLINHDLMVDMVTWFLDGPGGGWWPAPTLIIDEAQGFKSPSAKRFKALQRLKDGDHVNRVYELTGSPEPQGIEDLWPQMYLMDKGKGLGRTISSFRDRFEEPHPHVRGTWIPRRPKNVTIAHVHELARPNAMSATDPGVALAEPVIDDVMLHMDERTTRAYKRFEKEAVLALAEDGVVSASNMGVLTNKLVQYASGTVYLDPPDGVHRNMVDGIPEYSRVHKLKLEMLGTILRNSDTPVLVARWFKSDEREILRKFGPKSETPVTVFGGSREEVRAWNRGDIPCALVTPVSMGTGLNLQDGPGHTIVWYTLPMGSLMDYEQFNARIHRPGQKDTTVIHRLLTAGTMDERMVRILSDNAERQDALMASAVLDGRSGDMREMLSSAVQDEVSRVLDGIGDAGKEMSDG